MMQIELKPGLYYLNSHDEQLFSLGRKLVPHIERPDRDVLIALLRYTLDKLEAQTAAEQDTSDGGR